MTTHSSLLAWRITWTEKPSRLVHGVTSVGHDLVIKPNHHQYSCIPVWGLVLVVRDPGTVTEVQLYRLFPTGCCLRHCPTLNCTLLLKAQSLTVNRVFLTNKRGLFTENIIGLPWWLRRQRICLQCGRPGSMGSQRVGQDWETKHNMIREVIPSPKILTHHRNDLTVWYYAM